MSTAEDLPRYPLNIISYDPIHTDGQLERERLRDRSKDLFDCDADSSLEVLESDEDGANFSLKEIKNLEFLNTHLEERVSKTRFYYIDQEFSWGRMMIPKDMFLRLLSHVQVFPDFLEIVCSFGRKIGPKNEGYNLYSDSISQNANGNHIGYTYESCYILKYVERHERPELRNPWSVRQMGIYHRFDIASQTNTWIFLQSRQRFNQRLEELARIDRNFSTHLLLLSSSMENWGGYIDWLEEIYNDLYDIAVSSQVVYNPKAMKGDFPLDFSDMQRAQELKKKLLHLIYILELNSEAIEHMMEGAKRLADETHIGASLKDELSGYRRSLSRFLSTSRSHKRRAQNILHYMDGTNLLLQNILEERKGDAILQLSKIAREQSNSMLGLSMKTTWDARSMKTLTLVALFFLPPTFVSGFFGMAFFQDEKKMSVMQHLWLYGAVAIPLSVVTFSIWYIWERREKRRQDLETGRVREIFSKFPDTEPGSSSGSG